MSGFKMSWDGDRAIARIRDKATPAMRHCAEFVLDESRKQVPYRTGALSRSGAPDAEGYEATVSYDTPYAIKQHENRKYNHADGRKAKYLEDVVNSAHAQHQVMRYLQRELKI